MSTRTIGWYDVEILCFYNVGFWNVEGYWTLCGDTNPYPDSHFKKIGKLIKAYHHQPSVVEDSEQQKPTK